MFLVSTFGPHWLQYYTFTYVMEYFFQHWELHICADSNVNVKCILYSMFTFWEFDRLVKHCLYCVYLYIYIVYSVYILSRYTSFIFCLSSTADMYILIVFFKGIYLFTILFIYFNSCAMSYLCCCHGKQKQIGINKVYLILYYLIRYQIDIVFGL